MAPMAPPPYTAAMAFPKPQSVAPAGDLPPPYEAEWGGAFQAQGGVANPAFPAAGAVDSAFPVTGATSPSVETPAPIYHFTPGAPGVPAFATPPAYADSAVGNDAVVPTPAVADTIANAAVVETNAMVANAAATAAGATNTNAADATAVAEDSPNAEAQCPSAVPSPSTSN